MQSLPDGFHSSIKGRIKTMEAMKRGIKVGVKMVYGMETLFSWLPIVGQTRNISLASVFEYEDLPKTGQIFLLHYMAKQSAQA